MSAFLATLRPNIHAAGGHLAFDILSCSCEGFRYFRAPRLLACMQASWMHATRDTSASFKNVAFHYENGTQSQKKQVVPL